MSREADDTGPASPEELAEAFRLFNTMARELESSYAALERQVAGLESQLAAMDERRQREVAEKDRANRRLQGLLKLLPAGVVVLDSQGRVQEFNPAAEALLEGPLEEALWREVIERSFAPRADDGHEVSLRDGRRVALATRSLEGEPGQVILITDMTQTRALQAQVSQYQRLSAMGQMVASLAHQIRTPLSSAMLYSSHLLRESLPAEARIKFAGRLKGQLASLEGQLRDMLVFAGGETRLTDLLRSEDLMARIEDALDQPLTTADADCDCINECPGVWVQCNTEVLVGALMNLVNNALEATGPGADLRIHIRPEASGSLRLSVLDEGPGMNAEALVRAREPFYTTKSQGTGLGLAVAQVVARAHLGEFFIHSQPEQGTEAGFRLPCRSSGTEEAGAKGPGTSLAGEETDS